MMDDLFSFQRPYYGEPPHVKGSATSMAAAQSVSLSAATKREAVYQFIKSCGELGATDEEIINHFKHEWSANTPRARRVELVAGGSVIDSGHTRETASHRQATIWRSV